MLLRRAALVAAAVLASLSFVVPRAADAGTYTVTETETSYGGYYTLTTSPDAANVWGLIVSNSQTQGTGITNSYAPFWSSTIISAEAWNEGFTLWYVNANTGVTHALLDTSLLDDFSTYFGSDTKANAYWYSYGSVVIAASIPGGSTVSGFEWYDAVAASEYMIIGAGTNNILDTSLEAVPVPGALPLFATGLGFLAYVARRKKKADIAA